jgi:hypothetical protein
LLQVVEGASKWPDGRRDALYKDLVDVDVGSSARE